VFIDSKNRKKELQKKDYLEILRARKPSEISLKIDSETPSEYFLKILKILENEKIKKVVIETNYLKE
jgi:biopolymer transport protein ExbD